MMTPRRTVESSYGEGRVTMPMAASWLMDRMGFLTIVKMDVLVVALIMLVPMTVNMETPNSAKPPDAHANEHHAHYSLAPMRQSFHVYEWSEQEGDCGDDRYAYCVSDSPAQAQVPGPARLVGRKRRYGGQVVRSHENVQGARDKSGENSEHVHDAPPGFRRVKLNNLFGTARAKKRPRRGG
jgi:hypothetical protein